MASSNGLDGGLPPHVEVDHHLGIDGRLPAGPGRAWYAVPCIRSFLPQANRFTSFPKAHTGPRRYGQKGRRSFPSALWFPSLVWSTAHVRQSRSAGPNRRPGPAGPPPPDGAGAAGWGPESRTGSAPSLTRLGGDGPPRTMALVRGDVVHDGRHDLLQHGPQAAGTDAPLHGLVGHRLQGARGQRPAPPWSYSSSF